VLTGAGAAAITADDVYQEAIIRYESVGAEELGVVYQELMHPDDRKEQAAHYTPEQVAQFVARISLNLGIDQVGPEAGQVLRITAIDPACGAGIMLVHAARVLAIAYATRLVRGATPSGELLHAIMPQVILECVFGVDIDPVAVALARLALSLETAGTITPAMLDRHIVCDNVLDGPDHIPPALADRQRLAKLRHEM
jgi:type I restriction-modification system DNA methylase subunit